MNKMRVLMIAQSTYDYDARILRYCNALVENGYQVDVLALKYFNQSDYEEINGINIHRIMSYNTNKDSIAAYLIFSFIFLIKSFLLTIKLTYKYNYSFVHVHNMPDYLVFAALYPKLKRIPVILDIHDLTVELFKEKWSEKKFNKIKWFLIFVEKISCKFSDHIITVTKECVDILTARGINGNKITLIMNSPDDQLFFYDDSRFSKNGSDTTFRILYHGTLAKRFGLENALEALKMTLDKYPETELHIFGNIVNDYANELIGKAKDLEIQDKVFFHQSIPHNKVNEIIKKYDLGIVTYEPTEYMNLAFPTKAGEYALTGLPMIIADLIAVKSIFRNDSVFYVDTNNIQSISKAIIELIGNKEKRIEMSRNSLEDIEIIKWGKMKGRYLKLINNFK